MKTGDVTDDTLTISGSGIIISVVPRATGSTDADIVLDGTNTYPSSTLRVGYPDGGWGAVLMASFSSEAKITENNNRTLQVNYALD
jgi:hypothetical protein